MAHRGQPRPTCPLSHRGEPIDLNPTLLTSIQIHCRARGMAGNLVLDLPEQLAEDGMGRHNLHARPMMDMEAVMTQRHPRLALS